MWIIEMKARVVENLHEIYTSLIYGRYIFQIRHAKSLLFILL